MLNDKIKAYILVLYLAVYVRMRSHCPCKEISHVTAKTTFWRRQLLTAMSMVYWTLIKFSIS